LIGSVRFCLYPSRSLMRRCHHKCHGVFFFVRQTHRPFGKTLILRELCCSTVQMHMRFAIPIGQDFHFVKLDAEGRHDAQTHAERLAHRFFGRITRREFFHMAAARFDLGGREAAFEQALAVALDRRLHARNMEDVNAGR